MQEDSQQNRHSVRQNFFSDRVPELFALEMKRSRRSGYASVRAISQRKLAICNRIEPFDRTSV
jgi:hypothetical protein